MNKNIIIVFGGAVVMALMVSVLVQMMLGGNDTAPSPEEPAKVEVLVAAKNLDRGHVLGDGDTRWQNWPQDSVFPGAIVREGQQKAGAALKGRLSRALASGEPVMKSSLLGREKGNIVSASLEPGMRAISIDVSAASMVSGFIGPGDYVDVLLTYRERLPQAASDPEVQSQLELKLDKLATETILQNVKVLAIDQQAERTGEEKAKVGRTVTVAVDAEQAERLVLAAEMGDLVLVLRAVGDDVVFERAWPVISDARLTQIDDEIHREIKKIQEDSGANPNIVRIYTGRNVQFVPAN